MTQTTFQFDAKAPRLTGQRLKILERLRDGPATNIELVDLATHRFGGRLKELRDAGYKIKTINAGGGLFRYELQE